jgi:heme exporter protein C
MWWKWLLFVWIAAFSVFGLITPIAGGFGDLRMTPGRDIPVLIEPVPTSAAPVPGTAVLLNAKDRYGRSAEVQFPAPPAELGTAKRYIVSARYDAATQRVVAAAVLAVDPAITFPFIPTLEERARIIFFHVPMAWMTVVAFLVSMWFGIAYLRKMNPDDDTRSAVSAGLGLLFCILATTTGSVWAKFNWGSFWNWDPRETSIFVLLLVYGAYFALRSAIDVDEKKARLSAVYSILAAVTVPFFIFIMPRIMPGLHPGSSDDTSSGPVVSTGGMNATMRIALYGLLLGFLVLYGWLFTLRMRLHRLAAKAEA